MATSKTSSLVLRSSIIAALGGLLFGFDTAVISGTTDALSDVFNLSKPLLGLTVSSALIGTILGAATIQFPANKWGRKPTLLLIAFLYLISAIGSAFPRMLSFPFNSVTIDWYSFMFFRFIGGIGVGGASVVSPLYTAEIAPPKKRGFLVALTQFNIVFGILLAYISNFIIAQMHLGATEWRWMFGVEAIPAFLFFVSLLINPESPRWLIAKGRFDEGRRLLARLIPSQEEADSEFNAIQKALEEERAGSKERFFCWRYRKPIMLAFCIALFNQLSGINAILYYAPSVFLMAGADPDMAMFFPTIIGLTNFIFTMLALFFIDSFGRKTLMYVGSFGYILSLFVVGTLFTVYSSEFNASIERLDAQAKVEAVEQTAEDAIVPELVAETNDAADAVAEEAVAEVEAVAEEAAETNAVVETENAEVAATTSEVPKLGIYGVLIGLMVFIAAHAFGQGACIWVFIGEVFPNAVRAQGQALGSFTHWIMCAIVSGTFPAMLASLGPSKVFFFFGGCMVLQLLWVMFIMPETKQVPLEEMQKKLGIVDVE